MLLKLAIANRFVKESHQNYCILFLH